MHYAIISDLHGNLQGLEAVLADIGQRQQDSIVCLGDIIGYGPQPAETLDLCRRECQAFVLGNHDAVAAGLLDLALFNDDAQRSTRWTLAQLGEEAKEFFTEVPLVVEGEDLFFSHAALRDPAGFGYLDSAEDAAPEFLARPERMIFVGHTHHAKVFELNEAAGEVVEFPPEDFRMREGCRYIVNPGSVGDPRTPEPLARYASYEEETGLVRFHALAFDVDAYRDAWQFSRSPYQQYFHRCLDGSIPMTAEGERIAPPPLLVARKVAAEAGLAQRGMEARSDSPPLMARARPVIGRGRVAGGGEDQVVSLAGKERVLSGSGVSGKSTALSVEPEKEFPWMLVLLVLVLGICVWVGYLRFFTDVGIGMTRQAQQQQQFLQERLQGNGQPDGMDERNGAENARAASAEDR